MSSLYITLDSSHEKEENKEEGISELYVDLSKNMLHKERLVQKRVPVKHENGHVTYRMQWVKAHEDPKDMKEHPVEQQPQHIIHQKLQQQDTHHTMKDDSPQPKEERSTGKMIETSNLEEIPELITYRQQAQKCIEEVLPKYDDMGMKMSKLGEVAQSHWKVIRDMLLSDNEADDSVDTFVKNVRKGMLNRRGTYAFNALGSHPAVLKHALVGIMGEENYNKAKGQLKKGNLTINTDHDSIPSILEKGYIAFTPQMYLKKNSRTEEDYKKNIEILNEAYALEDDDEIHDKLREMSSGGEELNDRFEAEKRALGLDLEDRKPCYVAYNPDGSTSGGAPIYGDGGVVSVSNNVLNWCTVAKSDTFLSHVAVPRAYNMDHLQDLFILRAIDSLDNYNGGDTMEDQMRFFDTSQDENWMNNLKSEDEIPLELHYHKPKIEPEYLVKYSE